MAAASEGARGVLSLRAGWRRNAERARHLDRARDVPDGSNCVSTGAPPDAYFHVLTNCIVGMRFYRRHRLEEGGHGQGKH